MRNGLMTTPWTMNVIRIVSTACVVRRASVGIGVRNLDGMLIDVITVGVMEVSIVKIINVVTVLDGGVPTVRAVHVIMIGVFVAAHVALLRSFFSVRVICHGNPLSQHLIHFMNCASVKQ